MRFWLKFVAVLLVLAGAQAADGQTQSFTTGGTAFVFPMPDGFCLPTEQYDEAVRKLAAADSSNETMATVFSCHDMAAGAWPSLWGMLKTPRAGVVDSETPDRKALIAYFGSKIDQNALLHLNEAGSAVGSKDLSDALGKKVEAKADTKPLMTDDAAAYMGGTVMFTVSGNEPIPVAIAFSLTVVKGKMFFLYMYRRYHDDSDILDLLQRVKAATGDFVAQNGG